MSNDFDFVNPVKQYTKIDFKKVFFSAELGMNLVRVIASGGKICWSHYAPDFQGKKKFVKCPGSGCPLCTSGLKPNKRFFIKVIDRKSGLVKVWEFGSQIKTQMDEFVSDIESQKESKALPPDATLSDYNIEVRRREPGKNPLYMLSLRERLVGNDKFADTIKSDEAALASDEIDIEDLIKPWSIDRIKTQMLGQQPSEGGSPSQPSQPPVQQQVAASVAAPAHVQTAPTAQALNQEVQQMTDDGDDWLHEGE